MPHEFDERHPRLDPQLEAFLLDNVPIDGDRLKHLACDPDRLSYQMHFFSDYVQLQAHHDPTEVKTRSDKVGQLADTASKLGYGRTASPIAGAIPRDKWAGGDDKRRNGPQVESSSRNFAK